MLVNDCQNKQKTGYRDNVAPLWVGIIEKMPFDSKIWDAPQKE